MLQVMRRLVDSKRFGVVKEAAKPKESQSKAKSQDTKPETKSEEETSEQPAVEVKQTA